MSWTFVTFPPNRVADVASIVPPARKVLKYLPIRIAELDESAMGRLARIPGTYIHKSDIASYIPILRSIDALGDVGYPTSLNISLAPEPRSVDLREPIHVATKIMAMAGNVIVFAAGNSGPQINTLSPWAIAPWTICVGATDELGTKLLPISSVGIPGQSGPDVVANGKVAVPLREFRDDDHGTMVTRILAGIAESASIEPGYTIREFEGTSVSAPRVTRICHILLFLLRAALCARILLQNRTSGDLKPEVFQSASSHLLREAKINTPDIPFLNGIESSAFRPMFELAYELERRGVPLEPASFESTTECPFPVSVVKKLLARMARPIGDYAPHQVGSGFVSEKLALDYLGALSLGEFASIAFRSSTQLRLTGCTGMDRPMFHAQLLRHFVDVLATNKLQGFKVL